MRYRKFACFNYKFATRDEREMDVAHTFADDVAVVALAGANDNIATSKGIPIKRIPIEEDNSNKILWYAKATPILVKFLQEENADILSCHDIKALLVGYLSGLIRNPKSILVYDAHEYEIGRSSDLSKNQFLIMGKILLERFLMRRCAFTIVVNDTIADEMVRVHRLSERPVVVRSIPYFWERDAAAVSVARSEFCSALGVDPEESFLVMYHGGVVRGRGVETVIRAVGLVPDVRCVVLGDGEAGYLEELRTLAADAAPGRVLFHPAVPREGLEAYVAAADVGMVTVEAVTRSYYYMLPNKFFENVQAEVPMVVSDFPETGRLVREYGIGLACDPEDAVDVAARILLLKEDAALYEGLKARLRDAKRELCWERERTVLEEAYRGVVEA